jgi:hypothetical protein
MEIASIEFVQSRFGTALWISIFGGFIVTLAWSEGWHWYLRWKFPTVFKTRDGLRPIGITIGLIERGLITTLVVFMQPAVGPFAGAWIVVKAAAGWGSLKNDTLPSRSRYYVTLLGSLVSIFWAIAWGLWGMPKISN